MASISFLGPQRSSRTLRGTLDELGIDGSLGIVTAGWQDREGRLEEFEDAFGGRPAIDLGIYRRAARVFEQDPDLFAAHRERQNELRTLQRLYGIKLRYALAAANELSQVISDGAARRAEWRSAIAYVRNLDRRHLRDIGRVHARFEERWRTVERSAVRAQRRRIKQVLSGVDALLIAGGHVGVLLGRLRLLGIGSMIPDLPIIAWSAGAMALCERVVLFHDHAPQGPNEAEVFELGLGLRPGVVALPDARERLDLEDGKRVEMFARRFSPALCAVLDPDTLFRWQDGRLLRALSAHRLTKSGNLLRVATR